MSSYDTMRKVKQKIEVIYKEKYIEYVDRTGGRRLSVEESKSELSIKFRYWKISEKFIKEIESIYISAKNGKRNVLATENMDLLTNDDAVITSIFGKLKSANAGLVLMVETAKDPEDFIIKERQR